MRRIYLLSILLVLPAMGVPLSATATQAGDAKGRFYGARQTEYPDWFEQSFLDLPHDLAEATGAGKRLMLLFSQDGCPYCNALVERNLAQRDIEQTMRRHLAIAHINMWGDREVVGLDGKPYTEKTFAAFMKVQFTPTILFFDEQGKMILRLNGYLPPDHFKVALDYVTQKKDREIGYPEYRAARHARAARGALHAQDFFHQGAIDLRPAVVGKGKPIAVFFEQPDCPDCDTLHERVLKDKDIRAAIKQFHAVQLDMWSATPLITPDGTKTSAREWARSREVKYAPTVVLFDDQGKEVIRSEAMFKVFHTQGLFEYVLSGGYREQPSFQRWLSARAERLREQGKDVDIWSYIDERPGN